MSIASMQACVTFYIYPTLSRSTKRSLNIGSRIICVQQRNGCLRRWDVMASFLQIVFGGSKLLCCLSDINFHVALFLGLRIMLPCLIIQCILFFAISHYDRRWWVDIWAIWSHTTTAAHFSAGEIRWYRQNEIPSLSVLGHRIKMWCLYLLLSNCCETLSTTWQLDSTMLG